MLERINEIVAEALGADKETLTAETSFKDDLGADSLDIFQMIMEVEEVYDIEMDPDTVEGIQTVKGAVEAIRRITG